MSKEDLIPITSRPPHERRAIARKGGQVRSVKKRLAAQLREMRKHGVTNKRIKRWVDLMDNEDFSVLEIRKYIDMVMQLALQSKDINKINSVIRLMMDWHKMKHGGKNNDLSLTAVQPTEIIIEMPHEDTV